MKKLLPLLSCIWPDCKSEEVEIQIQDDGSATWIGYAVRCNNCGAYGPWANTIKNATKLWNSRKEIDK